ncbi:MAG TPA: hypothetical protein VH396_11015 [Chitinophagaceae bacterium]|jgi:Zn-dependent M16 (insulinase) family peptidase
MTPELKTACEVIFQAHKLSAKPIKWDSNAFHGRISIGLSEVAKETLIKKRIILLRNKSKIFTQLNPGVATANSFEEAEKMIVNKVSNSFEEADKMILNKVSNSFEEAEKIIVNKVPVLVTKKYDPDSYTARHVVGAAPTSPVKTYDQLAIADITRSNTGIKWYMRPIFLYSIWLVGAATAGIIISWLISLAVKLF